MKGLDGTAVVGVLTVVGILVLWALKRGYRGLQAFIHITELIVGKPKAGSVPAVPGLSERLGNIEYELKTNSGGSLRDLVEKTLTLAKSNAESVDEARDLAVTAVAKAQESADLLQSTEATAAYERRLMKESIEGLCAGLEDFAQEVHAKDMGTQRALRAAGLPISDIVEGEL